MDRPAFVILKRIHDVLKPTPLFRAATWLLGVYCRMWSGLAAPRHSRGRLCHRHLWDSRSLCSDLFCCRRRLGLSLRVFCGARHYRGLTCIAGASMRQPGVNCCLDELRENVRPPLQFLERTHFHNAAVVEHQDTRCVTDRGKPMGNNERRAVLHDLVKRGQHVGFGSSIERARRFIENQDRWILEQRPRDGQPLALAAR